MTLPFVPSATVLPARSAAGPGRTLFRDRWTLPLLLLLTLIGGVLRFTSLDHPSVWGDEAATYGRVAGTYQDLLDQLADSSFPPLHYELEWWIGKGLPYWGHVAKPDEAEPAYDPAHADAVPFVAGSFVFTRQIVPGGIRLTPFALRFIPALAGTLFIPGIFFLARQLFGPRVAILAAFVACFSAYALVYSRDAKMYMQLWCAATWHVGFALWWMRSRRPTAWALWLLSGLIMVGLHAMGFAVLALDALILFTSPRQNWRHFYTFFPLGVWTGTLIVGRVAGWVRLNRNWQQRRDWQKVAVWQCRARRRFRWPVAIGFAIGVTAMLSAAFGTFGYYTAFSRQVQKAADRAGDDNQVDLNELGIGWATQYNSGRQLPDYLLYTASAYLTGWEWPRVGDQSFDAWQTGTRMTINVRTLRLLQGATIDLLALLAVGLVPWRRAFSPARARLDRITQDSRVPRPVYRRRALWLALWLAVIPWGFYTQSVSRVSNVFDAAAALVLKDVPNVEWPRAKRHPEAQPVAATPTTAPASFWHDTIVAVRDKVDFNRKIVSRGYAEVTAALPAAWKGYVAAWNGQNVSAWKVAALFFVSVGTLATVIYARRRMGWRTLRLFLIVGLLVVLTTVMAAMPRWVDGIPWMPRYLGVIVPAVFIFVAVLIDRQPRRLRWVTLGLFVVVNMAQFSARTWAGSEPPTGLMAADMIAGQSKEKIPTQPAVPTFRAYFQFGHFSMAEPGGGTLFTPTGRYYMRLLSGIPGDVLQIRQTRGVGPFEDNLQYWKYPADRPLANAIDADLQHSPNIERFVTWTAMANGVVDQTDPVADKLKGRYKRVSEEIWQVRDHWRWVDRWQVCRRTYERVGGH